MTSSRQTYHDMAHSLLAHEAEETSFLDLLLTHLDQASLGDYYGDMKCSADDRPPHRGVVPIVGYTDP